ncbi:protein kinase domain-containing protein [Citrus sinensis]|uniref:Protein kinase domain-containing protein n=1 Tax=Citrus sinensis TaxID=2711 RepID=A0ACB8JA91_CITSI|nr:protein kinase domain-containing protein [Citrus sinensis]
MEPNAGFILHCVILLLVIAAAKNITTDQQALLTLKADLIDDPSSLLAKNWTSSTYVCSWIGITCDVQRHRVTGLNISYFGLGGTIPSQIGNLSSLETLDLSHNQLSGTIPSSIFTISTLKMLSLSFNDLSGAIPKEIGNLTMLKKLGLGYNKLRGEIPQELGNLAELELVSLTNNFLSGTIPSTIFNLSSLSTGMDFSNNSLTGSLPDDMCRRLPLIKGLYMSNNKLTGPIPNNIWQCKELIVISLAYNQFTERIPRGLGNLTSLKTLYLGFNNLTGEIPYEMGNLRNLEILGLQLNKLVGFVPTSIFNLSAMKTLALPSNALSGSLPSSIDLVRLPNLEIISLAGNNFSGIIPSFIFNASKLSVLELGENSFSGIIPNTLGNLRKLEWLRLSYNFLTSSTPELSFLSSWANCKNLKLLDLSNNPINGVLPSSIGNLSLSLSRIFISNCSIRGTIPKEIGNLINLRELGLWGNELIGSIPITFGKLQNLQGLDLVNNKLEGPIPNGLCQLARLSVLYMDGNKLSGPIPPCIGDLTSLRLLSLASNELNSVIPSTFWNLKDILSLNFSSNFLNGSLPEDIGNLKVVVIIDLSRNNLSGDIPTAIGGLMNLQDLSLRDNGLQGSIPKSIGGLVSLESLDLSNNSLSGNIPTSMEKLLYLKDLNLSFNKLEGEIPREGPFVNFSNRSFMGNDLLCGLAQVQVPVCKSGNSSSYRKSRKNTILLGVLLPLSTVFIIAVILAVRYAMISRCQERNAKQSNIEPNMLPQATRRRFSYKELLQATNQFNASNLIGTGGFGSVYKGSFLDGMEVAIKVFHLQLEGALKSFDVECEVLKSVRHRNLVKIISSCTNNDFKALVLEYMPNGSLEDYLYSNNFSFDILQRLSVIIDVALALEYLHFGYSNPVVHCDIKPSNVLLDKDMVAHLSDFGIAKLLSGEESMKQTLTLATIGYMAPEYGREGQVSTKGDVYSYGIMLMEIFTRKKPINEMFSGEMSLRDWVNDSLPISVANVVDINLMSREDKYFTAKALCVSSILSLAMECTSESPEMRINAKEIIARVVQIRDTLLANIEMVGA